MNFGKMDDVPDDAAIGLEAAEWLMRLDDSDPDDSDPDEAPEFPDPKARDKAFFDWIEHSPDHLRVFLETVETQRRMPMIDANHLIRVEDLLKQRFADVIPIHGLRPTFNGVEAAPNMKRRFAPERSRSAGRSGTSRGRRFGLVAAVILAVLGGGGYWWAKESGAYATSIGEQRTAKLDDGSFVYLNTDSKIEVSFSTEARNVRLVRGEALFVVERDSARPFTVIAGDTTVRAIGTQFNVRRRPEGADVAVVEGSVQVTAPNELQKLTAGEQTKVVKGRIAPRAPQPVVDALAWRQRRLVFHDARLSDVAEEFNRYNRTKIRIEGERAREIQLSGIFDADRPQALMLYAAKSTEFAVEPQGSDWVIRSR